MHKNEKQVGTYSLSYSTCTSLFEKYNYFMLFFFLNCILLLWMRVINVNYLSTNLIWRNLPYEVNLILLYILRALYVRRLFRWGRKETCFKLQLIYSNYQLLIKSPLFKVPLELSSLSNKFNIYGSNILKTIYFRVQNFNNILNFRDNNRKS